MRTMVSKSGSMVKVREWVLLSNGWEYYVIEREADGLCFCVVVGFETEAGHVYWPEVEPYVIGGQHGSLKGLAPAPGWRWEDAA